LPQLLLFAAQQRFVTEGAFVKLDLNDPIQDFGTVLSIRPSLIAGTQHQNKVRYEGRADKV